MNVPTVLINGIKLHRGPNRLPTGNFQQALHLAAELARRDDIAVQVLTDEDTHAPMAELISERQLLRTSFRGESVFRADREVLRQLRRVRPDVYHRPTGQLPFGLPRVLAVATVADLNFTVLPTSRIKWIYKHVSYRWTIHRADWITCISRFTRDEMVCRMGADPSRMSVIYNGTNPFPPADERFSSQLGVPYWITFGHERHKNVEMCLHALAEAGSAPGLVVIGATAYVENTLKPLTHQLGIESRVWFPGKVSSSTLHGLYRRALGLLFLSQYEGFGMPLLEAMSVACPVICSNSCSIPEVVGDAAVVINSDGIPAVVAAMERIVSDAAFRHALIARGKQRATQFSWANAAKETAELYRRLWKTRAVDRARQ